MCKRAATHILLLLLLDVYQAISKMVSKLNETTRKQKDMNYRQDLAQYIWDARKDADGIRPRYLGLFDAEGNVAEAWTLERLQAEAAAAEADVRAAIEHEERQQRLAAVAFECAIQKTIRVGAGDRDTAIRWLMDADDCDGDNGMFEYLNNLPYGYIAGGVGNAKLADLI